MIVTGESEGMFKEVTVEYFKVIQHFRERIEGKHAKSQSRQPTSDPRFESFFR
jgi:hypothetical protein